jgi:hypothetical protein
MPVPFRDLVEGEPSGLAAYFKVIEEPNARGLRAALFCITARGEPVDFTFSRIALPSPVLWRAGDQRRNAVAALCKVLFAATSQTPTLLLVLADEVPPRVLGEDLEVRIPACRLSSDDLQPYGVEETPESLDGALNLFWSGAGRPPEGSEAHALIEILRARNLILEPFERATRGLDEAFQGG